MVAKVISELNSFSLIKILLQTLLRDPGPCSICTGMHTPHVLVTQPELVVCDSHGRVSARTFSRLGTVAK